MFPDTGEREKLREVGFRASHEALGQRARSLEEKALQPGQISLTPPAPASWSLGTEESGGI